MGLTKQYLRYAPANIFGIIAGNKSSLKFINYRGTLGKYAAVGACEYVFIWDVRKNELVSKHRNFWKHKLSVFSFFKTMKLIGDNKSEVTCIEQNPKNHTLAVGYLDGSIRIFDLRNQNCLLTFNGHKSSIMCLNFDHDGLRLVSGSKDTDIVLWDLVAESGLFRLKGHKAMITQTVFMKNKNILISWLEILLFFSSSSNFKSIKRILCFKCERHAC